jgi:hypothetical protein
VSFASTKKVRWRYYCSQQCASIAQLHRSHILTSSGAIAIGVMTMKRYLTILFVLILEPDAPATRVKNNKELKRQRIAKRMKVEIARELGDKKAAEKTIERIFFRNLYYSEYCMKGDPKVVAQKLKQLKLESAKRDALKNNIYIRTKGFGWMEFHITMIHNWKYRSC